MITLIVLASAMLTAVVDRRFSSQTLKLAVERESLPAALERSPAGVYRSTIDGRLLDVNDACFRIFGYASREEAWLATPPSCGSTPPTGRRSSPG